MLTLLAALVLPTPGLMATPRTNWPMCRLTHPAQIFRRLEDLPRIVQDQVRSDIGEIAAPGEPFTSTDAGFNGPIRRFLQGIRSGRYWIIWYEHGGRGLHRHVLAYGIGVSGLTHEPRAMLEANFVGNDPCSATDAILDGVRSAGPNER
jgi:hypothetical protein